MSDRRFLLIALFWLTLGAILIFVSTLPLWQLIPMSALWVCLFWVLYENSKGANK